jgi:hypothetical protein
MINLPISDIIRDSFKLAWKYKYLWLFGLFVAGNSVGNIGGDLEPADFDAAYEWFLAALVAIVLIGFAVLVVVMVLHVISKSALIYNVYQIETGGAHSISGGWDFGVQRFWPMLGVTLLQLVVAVAFIVVLILIEVAFFLVHIALGFFSLLFALPALFAGLMTISLVWTYAERFVALETRGVIESLGEGMTLLRSQWRPSLLMLLVKIGIGLAFAFGLVGVGAALFLPAVALWVISKPLAIVYGVLVLLPFTVLLTSYIGTFDSAVWTKVFLQLRAPSYAASDSAPAEAAPAPPQPDRPDTRPPLFE